MKLINNDYLFQGDLKPCTTNSSKDIEMRPIFLLLLLFPFSVLAEYDFQNDIDLMATPLDQRANKWLCEPKVHRICSKDKCDESDSKVWIKINFKEGTYSRCDSKGCNNRLMSYFESGVYTRVQVNGAGTMVTVLNDGTEYSSAVSFGTSFILSFGSCRPIG